MADAIQAKLVASNDTIYTLHAHFFIIRAVGTGVACCSSYRLLSRVNVKPSSTL